MDGRLRTFCHISEYDEAGYRQLHRLIAASDPLVLWAPSSQFLSDPRISRVSPDDFLHFVEEGMVQVVARERWLDSRSFRDSHAWPGARWNKYIDSALWRMFRDDEGEPDLRRRRVAAAPEESGPDQARRTIEERPDVAAEIVDALRDGRRAAEIPPGTLATAERAADDAYGKAEIVLRDAYNHADAMSLTAAETAILLSPGDGVFAQLVAANHAESIATAEESGEAVADRSSSVTAAQLSRQLVDLLAMLETLGPPADLRSFMEGNGHRDLVEWSRSAIDLLVSAHPTKLKQQLVDQLRSDLERGAFRQDPLDERVVEAASLAIAMKGLLEGSELLVLFGLAFDAYPLLKRKMRDRDLADAEFTGPQWPFRYLWNTGARHGRHGQLLDLLES